MNGSRAFTDGSPREGVERNKGCVKKRGETGGGTDLPDDDSIAETGGIQLETRSRGAFFYQHARLTCP